MEDEMGRACSTHGRDVKHGKYSSRILKGRGHSKDVDVGGKITELIFEKQGR
jgi:hypothetical protein